MRGRRHGRRVFWASLGLLALGVGLAVGLAAGLAQRDDPPHPLTAPPHPGRPGHPGHSGHQRGGAESESPGVPPPLAGRRLRLRAAPPGRRLRVAGAEGFFVVINPDGSGVLEGPDGRRTPLASAGELSPPPAAPRAPRLRPAAAPRGEVGQLVVCDEGVVDVPPGAVITYVGKDKVVTHDPAGASVVYHVSGRVERRGRSERAGRGEGPAAPAKGE